MSLMHIRSRNIDTNGKITAFVEYCSVQTLYRAYGDCCAAGLYRGPFSQVLTLRLSVSITTSGTTTTLYLLNSNYCFVQITPGSRSDSVLFYYNHL
ncbi:hypothetical protein LENED_005828 [Lentinula edodes]|uniref:Uncharacterized protein n=1 Tax=Lentinula edodes TaxID=5353 RepID=A0A1Q3EA28_LENED|nr:hypothetical protein LENED_005828 [Lentinula edodes]